MFATTGSIPLYNGNFAAGFEGVLFPSNSGGTQILARNGKFASTTADFHSQQSFKTKLTKELCIALVRNNPYYPELTDEEILQMWRDIFANLKEKDKVSMKFDADVYIGLTSDMFSISVATLQGAGLIRLRLDERNNRDSYNMPLTARADFPLFARGITNYTQITFSSDLEHVSGSYTFDMANHWSAMFSLSGFFKKETSITQQQDGNSFEIESLTEYLVCPGIDNTKIEKVNGMFGETCHNEGTEYESWALYLSVIYEVKDFVNGTYIGSTTSTILYAYSSWGWYVINREDSYDGYKFVRAINNGNSVYLCVNQENNHIVQLRNSNHSIISSQTLDDSAPYYNIDTQDSPVLLRLGIKNGSQIIMSETDFTSIYDKRTQLHMSFGNTYYLSSGGKQIAVEEGFSQREFNFRRVGASENAYNTGMI